MKQTDVKMINKLFFFFICIGSTDLKFIKKDFFYCNKTNEILDISCKQSLNKMDCLNFINFKYLLKQNMDKFSFINIFNETKVVFLNNEIFDTKCSIIPEIELVEKVDRCTNDLLVKFNHNNQQKTGFLTYEKIIRNSSYIIPCNFKKKYYTTIGKNIQVFTQNKMIHFEVSKLGIQNYMIGNEDDQNASYFKSFLDFYENYIHDNRAIQISEDGFFLIFIIISIISRRKKK
jgi:hypothetical protein